MRDYVASLLAGSYAVETAPDGAGALEMARADPPDLVLTDVMMPNLDGFGLLAALQEDPATLAVPGRDALGARGRGGHDRGPRGGRRRLPGQALLGPRAARPRAREPRAGPRPPHPRPARAQRRAAGQGAAARARRLVGDRPRHGRAHRVRRARAPARASRAEEILAQGLEATIDRGVHPDDAAARARGAGRGGRRGAPLDLELRLVRPDGTERTYRALGEVERDDDGRPVCIRGSNQDITDQRAAEQALRRWRASARRPSASTRSPTSCSAACSRRPALRPRPPRGRDLLPPGRRGHPGRRRLVRRDRARRGPHRAGDRRRDGPRRARRRRDGPGAGRGARLRPAGPRARRRARVPRRRRARPDAAQIVTCIYAVYDPRDRSLAYANAGHLPPLIAEPGEAVRRCDGPVGPPLGSGPFTLTEERETLAVGARLALYTDGLVERRTRSLDDGIDGARRRAGGEPRGVGRAPARAGRRGRGRGHGGRRRRARRARARRRPSGDGALPVPAEADMVPQTRRS